MTRFIKHFKDFMNIVSRSLDFLLNLESVTLNGTFMFAE
jgi:hypothetical protein